MGAFPPIPEGRAYRLVNARLPRCLLDVAAGGDAASEELVAASITVADGKIEHLELDHPHHPSPSRGEGRGGGDRVPAVIDLQGGMVWPACADLHTHLDKGFIWDRAPNPSGSWQDALAVVERDRSANWQAEDVAARMDFALRCAYAHGTAAIRTHIDSFGPQAEISWPVFAEMRARWLGRIVLQGSALVPLDYFAEAAGERLADIVAAHQGILGTFARDDAAPDAKLDRLFAMARERDLDIDIHADETPNPESNALEAVAAATIRHGWQGRVTCGHCCSLAVRPPEAAARTIARVAEAGVAVVALPLCNLYLQDRAAPPHTPRWRGVTLMNELAAAGVKVAAGSDNVRDPFYAYGDLDAVEVFIQSVRIAHLDHPLGGWARAVTATPAGVMGVPDVGMIRAGGRADLILFRARSWGELLARPAAPRQVIRDGVAVDSTPPDYRELDGVLG